MASNSLGTLTLDLVAKIGGFTGGLSEAERASKKTAKAIQANLEVASQAVGIGIGAIAAAVGAVALAFPSLIEQAARFQDIADKTGGSAEGFANFAVSAKVAGVGIEDIANASVKLSKNLVGVDDDSKAAGAALAALNIPIDDFKKLKPDEQIKTVAEAFGNFADGANKAAVAQALFGKSGADLLKFFKDYTDNGGDVTILTAQQIQQADDYSDRLARQKETFLLTASAVATQFLPAITALTSVMTDLIKETVGVSTSATDLGNNNSVESFVDKSVKSLGVLLDAAQLVARTFDILGTAIGATAATGAAIMNRDFKAAINIQAESAKDLFNKVATVGDNLISQRVTKSLAAQKKALDDQNSMAFYSRGGKPQLNYNGVIPKAKGGGSKDDPTKKLLDNDLAAFKAQGEQAKELLAERNKMLDLYNSQGLISVKDYYASLQSNLDEATKAQAKSYDDQINALKTFQAAATKQTDVADAQGKINKLEEDKAKLYRASGTAAIESSIKQVQAQKAVQDAFNEVNAKILEFNGNLRAAAEIRFDASNEKLLKQAVAEGNDETVNRIGLLKQYTLAQADITKATDAFSLAQGDLQIQEDRITMAQQRGTMGEIQALKASGDARRAAIAPMQEQLDTLLAINDAVRTPQQNQAIERLKLQLEQLKATADPLADKFNTMFGDAAGNAFGDFITGAKSAKEAFQDFSKTIINEIARMAAKDLAKSIFGSGGDATGGFGLNVGGMLSSLFGGGGSGGGAAVAASNAIGAVGGDSLGTLIGLKGWASGGFTGMGAANDPAGIVHKSEYVLDSATTRRIGVANLDRVSNGGGLGMQQVNNFSIQGQIDRRTETQLANKLRRETNTANARFR